MNKQISENTVVLKWSGPTVPLPGNEDGVRPGLAVGEEIYRAPAPLRRGRKHPHREIHANPRSVSRGRGRLGLQALWSGQSAPSDSNSQPPLSGTHTHHK